MSRKKELSYLKLFPNSPLFEDIIYTDFICFNKINEYLDFEELFLLERENDDGSTCQSLNENSLIEWITCNEFRWMADGALQHSFAVYCLLITLFVKCLVQKSRFRS